MPNVHSDDDISLASERHYRKDGSINSTKLAAELNMPRTTVQRALARLARQGRLGTVPVLPGFGLKQTTAVFGRDGELQREFVKQTHLGDISGRARRNHRRMDSTEARRTPARGDRRVDQEGV